MSNTPNTASAARRLSAWLVLAAALLCVLAPTVARAAPSTFDHFTTGFELLGQHKDAACAQCHVGGIFKGTPRDCFACHAAGSRIGATAKPSNHIISNNDCAQCHTPFSWTPVARFNHLNVLGTCSSCHNNVQTIGKPTKHVPTSAECNNCHVVTKPWKSLNYPSNHIPTAPTSLCTDCHTGTNFAIVPTLTAIHQFAPSSSSNCAQCHGSAAPSFAIPAIGFTVVGMPTTHLPTQAACESCHVGAGSSLTLPVTIGAKFTNSAMSHAGITSNCASCHGSNVTASSFFGITNVIVFPSTASGATSHVPSGQVCESCHAGSTPAGLVPANATKAVPGTGFQTPAPTTAMIHAGITTSCNGCHENTLTWADMAQYPLTPGALNANPATQYTGFHLRPSSAGGAFILADKAHPTSGDCSQCHTRTDYFEGNLKPSNHIPYSTSAQCTDCHKDVDFSVWPALSDIHTFAQSTTTNCIQCHGSKASSFAIPAANNFKIVAIPAKHVSSNADAACETCHVGATSSIKVLPVVNGATFANSAMSHAGITSNCVSCHGSTITGSSFYGITSIVAFPSTTPGATAHVPSGQVCETCHGGSTPAGLVPANATKVVPGTLFQTPVPTTAMIHTGITTGCNSCHENTLTWADMNLYPLTPSALTGIATSQYTGFHLRPNTAGGASIVADNAHPTSGDCSQCHTRTDYFEGNLKPSNHIPYVASAQCGACHKVPDFSVWPALTDIHANAQSTTTNCIQCHGSTAASFAIPAANNFKIVAIPAKHVSSNADAACETCHVGATSSIKSLPVVNGATFANSAMSHAGITSNCVSCHGSTITGSSFAGITTIVVFPSTTPGATAHVPSGQVCENCHGGSTPAGLVPANATKVVPGTLFQTPVPTTAMIHTGITTGCNSCHENTLTWADMNLYPLTPAAFTGNATTQYTGFNLRPNTAGGAFILADTAHPSSGDCSTCHARTDYFEGNIKPSNHIPYAATAVCANCHTTSDFSAMPTLLNIHSYAQSTTANCSQCHGSTVAGGFAIPAANFSIVTTPSNHVPSTASCEACHVGAGSSVTTTPVPNGAKFSGSAMSHAGLTTCVGCHGPTITGASFAGITKIVVMPPTSPVGASSHIPSATTCETCHAGSMPAGLIAANATKTAPGTAFAAPIPTTAMIHTGITSSCNSCHETPNVWMDMTSYPISPKAVTGVATTQYLGFQTRPVTAAGTYNVADAAHPATGDCSQCHSGFNFFSAQAEPTNHIPTLPGATCATCHTTAGNFAVYTTDMTVLHTEVSTTCSTCHSDGKSFAGASGPNSFTPVELSTRGLHIPITNVGAPVECSGCHKTVTTFTGTIMSHAAIGDSANSATGNACDACHEFGYRAKFYGITINFVRDSATHKICGAAGTPTAPNVTICSGGGSDCLTGCHQHNNIPSKYASVKPGTPAKQIKSAATPATPTSGGVRRPMIGAAAGGRVGTGGLSGVLSGVDHGALGGAACQSCHNGAAATGKAAGHPATTAMCRDCHSTLAWAPVLHVDHADVLGTCATCHDGTHARGKAAAHPNAGADCDRCHTTSAWTPAAFDHKTVLAGTCASCHNAITAPGKPAAHVVTLLSCDSCHYVLAWKPAKPVALPPKPTKKPLTRPTPTPRGRDPSSLAPPL